MNRVEKRNVRDKLNSKNANRSTQDGRSNVRKSGKHADSRSSKVKNLARKSSDSRNRVRNRYIEEDEEENDVRVKVGRNGKPLKTKAEFINYLDERDKKMLDRNISDLLDSIINSSFADDFPRQ